MKTPFPLAPLAPRLAVLLLAGASLALAGCQQQAGGQNDAPAEVLSGTISDAMLPYDTVTSQPPLDPRAARAARSGADGAEAEATDAAPASGAPAASPVAGAAPAE